MNCRLIDPRVGIPIDEMNDGAIAVITKWKDDYLPAGTLLQRCGESIILLGRPWSSSFPSFFKTPSHDFYVRILEPGEIIWIE